MLELTGVWRGNNELVRMDWTALWRYNQILESRQRELICLCCPMNGWRSRFRPPLTNPLGIKLTVSILVGESNHIMGRTSPTYRPPAAFYGPCETARIGVYILRESSSTSMLILCYTLCRMFLQKVDLAAIQYRRWVGPLCHCELIEVRWRNCNALHQFMKIECK